MEIVRKRKSRLHIELTPLVDVVFQLLIFFMLASSFSKPAIELNLPRAVTVDPSTMEQVVVSISGNGAVAVNGTPVAEGEFPGMFAAALKASGQASVHIRGDSDVPYGEVLRIVDLARRAGAEQVNLVHEVGE
ncbi:MAG: biopolymer transporter ExbD [Candidatus Omnitrophica bacterium]|nr:biopolymer transporter ExbD [Candidatus Omnitrophota bacterium]MCB9721438.1 biopolymer transporter ExbD [Candidatus Omnitrophota bacterium]